VLSYSPVVRSTTARAVFLTSAAISAAILWGTEALRFTRDSHLASMFLYLFAQLDYSGAIVSLLILGAAVFCRRPDWLRPMLAWIADHAVSVAVATGVLLCAGTLVVYRNHPLSMDEYAAFFQSRIFASGSLTGRFPIALLDWLVPPTFQDHFLTVSHSTGEVAETYWPSFALLLTPFTRLGIPWACNPAISAVTVLLVRTLTLQVFESREAAGLAMLMTISSPVFFANGISYYSMPAHLLANTAYAVLLVRPTAVKALLAGIVGSIALTLHNPVPHLLFAVPWLIWIARHANGRRLFGALCAGYLPLSVLLGIGWFLLSRHLVDASAGAVTALTIPRIDSYLKLGSNFGLPTSPVLLARLIGVAKLWVWAVPGLLIIAGVGAWKWRHDEICRLLAASAVLTLLAYLFVPFDQGHGWGYRYFHSAWIALPVLAAGAFTSLRKTSGEMPRFEDNETCSLVVSCALLTLVLGVGLRAIQIHELISYDLRQVPVAAPSDRTVVIIDSRFSSYGLDLVQNDPWLRDSAIRMASQGPEADARMMMIYFPDMHRVFASALGTVWSAEPVRSAARLPARDLP
jgi:hypothetical protein